MLDELLVENLGLIATARLEPGPGLVALTGETGAGKTLLLGALRLLRGDQARSDRIGPNGPEARVEGRFLLADGSELTVGRRVAEGRSRAYLDGTMTPARALEERLDGVIEIIGQNEHVTLARESTVRMLVDAVLDEPGRAARDAYTGAWANHRRLLEDRAALGGDRHALERELDLALHQSREIETAGFTAGEDDELAERLSRLRHAEEIAAAVTEAHAALADEAAAADRIGEVVEALRRVARHHAGVAHLEERVSALAAEISEAAGELRNLGDAVEHDPELLEQAERRMALLGDLRRKYGDTLDEVLAFREDAARRAEEIRQLLQRAESLSAELDDSGAALATTAAELTESRRTAAASLASGARAHLLELGFRDPVLQIEVHPDDPGQSGADRLELLFASDAELTAVSVGRVASGGELSRLVLAIRLAGGVADVPVVAFDEIDAGVGGSTALAMGAKLADLAAERQVLVVTHLPQVAAFADTHFVLERSATTATVRRVEGEERLGELTRMLGGLPESERGKGHAAELVAVAAEHRDAAGA